MTDITQFIKKVLLAFEQSRTTIKYNAVYVYNDGPKDIKQITLSFGITEYGNLKKFLQEYCSKEGQYADQFATYIPVIGSKALASNTEFINLLKKSAEDPIMQQCQEDAFDSMYITPALSWCREKGLSLPLSQLVISDSFLQSGSILKCIREKFSATLPVAGGDEREWVHSYCKARKEWLVNHSRKALNSTFYRMNFMLSVIDADDWNLASSVYIANDVKIVAN